MDCGGFGTVTEKTLTIPELRAEGLKALRDRLGPAGTLRFLQLFDPGKGDYTADREQWLKDLTVDEITRQIEARRDGAE
ncbi:MAG: hypothetical protein KKB50_18035 [Planctomycetes bacterium]|nr:hypothetical protein [Planctomycetota bacterium]